MALTIPHMWLSQVGCMTLQGPYIHSTSHNQGLHVKVPGSLHNCSSDLHRSCQKICVADVLGCFHASSVQHVHIHRRPERQFQGTACQGACTAETLYQASWSMIVGLLTG